MEKLWEVGIRGKIWRMMKNMTECVEKCCDAERGNIMLIFYKELHRDVRCHPMYSGHILMTWVAVQAAKQGDTVREIRCQN